MQSNSYFIEKLIEKAKRFDREVSKVISFVLQLFPQAEQKREQKI